MTREKASIARQSSKDIALTSGTTMPNIQEEDNATIPTVAAPTSRRKKKKSLRRQGSKKKIPEGKRTRVMRPYPASSFEDARPLADAIMRIASGEKVRRLTLLEKMDRTPTSSSTQMLITNSSKYGITKGSYAAEWIELTDDGKLACDITIDPKKRLSTQFKLAIENIPPFQILYKEYVGKKLPAHEVMRDALAESDQKIPDFKECIDFFVVNAKYLGLLRPIAGAETLVSIEQILDESAITESLPRATAEIGSTVAFLDPIQNNWDSVCFYVAPIGDENSETRKHSNLFMESLIEPAIKGLGLNVIRADKIAEPGMITANVLEHLKKARLVIADLSLLNPNVFYEMALRHAVRLPIVQIIRKVDRLPFDVNQVNTIVIDDTDIYSLVPQLETYKSQISTLAKRALEDPEHIGNPISVFYPDFWK